MAMKVIRDGLFLCTDCTYAAINDDYSSLDFYGDAAAEREQAIRKGLKALGPHLASAGQEFEFMHRGCDCCGDRSAGDKMAFAILAPVYKPSREQILRRCVFTPYLPGRGPSFRLMLWDTGRTDYTHGPKSVLGYRLTQHEPGKRAVVLFEGEDYCCAPSDPIDSDAAVAGIMCFLTLKPGDTDPEHFERYSREQSMYASQHAEALNCEVACRFGEY